MNRDDRARLRAHADDYENAADVHALLDHIDQVEHERDWNLRSSREAKARAIRAEAQVRRVRALHEHRAPEPPYVEYCEHCGVDWPCQTVRVLDGGE